MSDEQTVNVNDNLILIGGKSATGKSASLKDLKNPEGVLYLNCESGKKLPFRSKFIEKVITDPYEVLQGFEWAEDQEHIHTIVVDSLTFLLEMFVSLYIAGQQDGRAGWGNYAQFFKELMQQKVAASSKNVIFMAHTGDKLNESEAVMETSVTVQGSLKNVGVEAYFSVVVASKKMKIKDLKNYTNAMLVITPEEEALGFKYVFQCKITKETVNERIRGPIGMFTTSESYIDNNVQLLLEKLNEFYNEP